jgi:hypothetical protein
MLRLANIVETAINPALAMLPKNMDSPKARVMLLAIGLQESRFEHRAQIVAGGGKGPARGFWQFECGTRASRGGVWGVYLHNASTEQLRLLCRERDCNFDPRAIWSQIERDDVLAAGVARLLLWTDPGPLPEIGDEAGAWELYAERCWRPGKPHRKTWAECYRQAVEEVVPPQPATVKDTTR